MVANARAFRHFAETQYKLSHWANRQRDEARTRTQVSPALIFCALIYQAVLGIDSLLDVEQWLRSAQVRRLLNNTGRRCGPDPAPPSQRQPLGMGSQPTAVYRPCPLVLWKRGGTAACVCLHPGSWIGGITT